jgi:hypothetical protein
MSDADQNYGRAAEAIYAAGHSFERAMRQLEWLLQGDRWQSISPGFSDVNRVVDSFRLDKELKIAAEQRKRIATRIKELQPTASTRRIAGVVRRRPRDSHEGLGW